MTSAALTRAGLSALDFSSPSALLARVRHVHETAPSAAIVDARTALGYEHDIRNALHARLVVLTTWPEQVGAWLTVGASRFLLKPFDVDVLLEHLDPDGFLTRARAVTKASSRSARQTAA